MRWAGVRNHFSLLGTAKRPSILTTRLQSRSLPPSMMPTGMTSGMIPTSTQEMAEMIQTVKGKSQHSTRTSCALCERERTISTPKHYTAEMIRTVKRWSQSSTKMSSATCERKEMVRYRPGATSRPTQNPLKPWISWLSTRLRHSRKHFQPSRWM